MSESSKRFQCIPRTYENGCIYAVELENGVVKVGRSLNPRSRMVGLRKDIRRTFDCDLTRFYIGPDLASERAVGFAERALIDRVGAEASLAKPGRTEFFAGISFERALALVDAVSLNFRKPLKSGAVDVNPIRFDSLDLHGLKHVHASHSTPLN